MKKFLYLCLTFALASGVFVQNTNAQAPAITSFTPATGPLGTLVTITGTNLGNPTSFTIGGVTVMVISNTSVALSADGTTALNFTAPARSPTRY
ncbi:MAG: IPT/TIG domain-containing protein [Bacteroidetes bacterium]|nr:IPT/TIG domain-containing protein [Bacteroidota bacterium]